jgi:hypothetical protein
VSSTHELLLANSEALKCRLTHDPLKTQRLGATAGEISTLSVVK